MFACLFLCTKKNLCFYLLFVGGGAFFFSPWGKRHSGSQKGRHHGWYYTKRVSMLSGWRVGIYFVPVSLSKCEKLRSR